MVLRELERYSGVPFVEKGRDLNGFDCWGLVAYVGNKHFNRNYPSNIDKYESPFDYEELEGVVRRDIDSGTWEEIPKGKEVPGDVVLLRMRGRPIHVGIVVSDGLMLHTERGIGVVLERYNSSTWKNRLLGFWRYNDN